MLKPPRLAKNMHGGGRRHRTASGTGAGGVTALLERHALVRPAQNGSSEIEDVSSEALVLLEHARARLELARAPVRNFFGGYFRGFFTCL